MPRLYRSPSANEHWAMINGHPVLVKDSTGKTQGAGQSDAGPDNRDAGSKALFDGNLIMP